MAGGARAPRRRARRCRRSAVATGRRGWRSWLRTARNPLKQTLGYRQPLLMPYGRLLRTAGAPRLAASLIALGLASTMAPVGFVLFARNATGSFGTAGLVLAASTAGGLLLAPLRGRLV